MPTNVEELPGPILAAIVAAVSVVMGAGTTEWEIKAIAPIGAGTVTGMAGPWTTAGRLQLMADRRWMQSRRTKS